MKLILITTVILIVCYCFRNRIFLYIKQIQLRDFLSKNERNRLSYRHNNQSSILNNDDDWTILDSAYKALSRARITVINGQITIKVPVPNSPEVQDYVKDKLNKFLIRWLNQNFPNKHWSQPELKQCYFFEWVYIVHQM